MTEIALEDDPASAGPGGSEHAAGLDATLENNLCALLEVAGGEEFISRVLRADRGNHVIIGGPNPPLYRSQGRLREFVVRESSLAHEIRDVRDGEEVFVFGIGLGEQVAHLLRTRPEARVVVWDRDPWLVRLALTRQDYADSLASGRLRICMGADLVSLLPVLHERRVVLHPAFRAIYADEMRLVSESVAGVAPSEGRRWIGLGMGGVIVTDLAESLRSEGYSVFPLEVTRWKPDETRDAIATLSPERVVTVNYDDDVARVCGELGIPLAVWVVDPSTDRTPQPPANAADIRIFTLRAENTEAFSSAGFPHVRPLALGVDVEKRRPLELSQEELSKYAAQVSFVGSSLIDRARRFRRLFLQLHASFDCCGSETFEETEDRLERVLAAERADYSTYVIDDVIEEQFGEFLEAARRGGTPSDPKKWLAEIVASQKRIAYVSALADEGVQVWGDDGWEQVSREVANLQYRGVASFGYELTLVYNGADINVDVNRIYQPDVVPIRVFDVLSCGGFLIAEYSDALAKLFDVGTELESYRSLTELEEKVAYYREHTDEARSIGERGMAAVRERHTMRQRVKEIFGA